MRILLGLLGLSPLFLLVALAVFFSRLKRSVSKQLPMENGSRVEFFPVKSLNILITTVLFLLGAFTVLVFVAIVTPGGSPYALLIPLSVFVAILLAKPKTVVVDEIGIKQRHVFGIESIIPWHDVNSISYGANTGTTYVISKSGGLKIRFSAFLVGRQRFKSEVHKHLRHAIAFEGFESEDEDL